MLQNAYFLAKIGADTAENERHFAEHLPKIGNYAGVRGGPWRRRPAGGRSGGPRVSSRLQQLDEKCETTSTEVSQLFWTVHLQDLENQ